MSIDDTHPDLSALLLGNLPNVEALDAGVHLERCQACRGELAELAAGHAVLLRSSRLLTGPAQPEPNSEDLPPLDPPPRSRHRLVALVAAAAVAVVAGLALVTLVDNDSPAPPEGDPTTVVHTLTPLDEPGSPSEAQGTLSLHTIDDGVTQVQIRTDDLPATDPGEFYEAWLLDPATNKMLALGPIGALDHASYDLPQRLLDRYSVVDISLESDDGDPTHSLTSVLRGTYT
ncbi:MAG TPA: anti-sigma factor [Nocardioides sp.]|nr:anti-sigma factor [Nocardioides sp.]